MSEKQVPDEVRQVHNNEKQKTNEVVGSPETLKEEVSKLDDLKNLLVNIETDPDKTKKLLT